MADSLTVIDLGTGRTTRDIEAGDNHTCAILDDASVKCWGSNASGQLGLGDTNNRGDASGEMGNSLPAVDLGSERTATAIAAGNQHHLRYPRQRIHQVLGKQYKRRTGYRRYREPWS